MSFRTTRILPVLMAGTLLAAPSQAQCPTGDDVYEDNDDCANSALIAPGSYTGLIMYGTGAAGGSDFDYYNLGTLQLQVGETLLVQTTATNGASYMDVDFYRSTTPFPGGCTGTNSGTSINFGSGNAGCTYLNTTTGPVYMTIVVDGTSTSLVCAEYDMTITILPAPCSGPDDVYEDNDTCATAVAFPTSGTIGLQVHGPLYGTGQDSDFWTTTVAAGDRLEIDLSFTDSFENIDAFLYDVSGGCPGVLVDSGVTTSNNEALQWDNTTGLAVPVVLEVIAGDTNNSCNEYVLTWSTSISPCGQPDDSLEDNDDCASAVPLPLGTTTGLWVFGAACTVDNDFYSITVPNGDRVSVDVFFSDVIGDIDLYAYAVIGCPGLQVASATTTTDNETLYYDNLTGGPLNVVIEVRADLSTFESNTYDMTASVGLSPCASDDVFEPNDTCATAVPITPGSYTGLKHFYNNGSGENFDWYTIDVQPLDTLVTELFLVAANGDLDADYYDISGGCPGTLEGSTTGLNSDHVTHTWINDTGTVSTVAIRVDRYSDTYLCQDYDMDITIVPNTCIGDDVYEDNDDCTTAALLSAGTYTGLRYYYNGSTTNDDEDWYEVVVPGVNDLIVTLDHVSASGAMDVDVYDACGGSLIGTQTGTSTDQVIHTSTNFGTGSTSFFIRVDRQTGIYICNDYDLTIATVPSTNPCIGDDTFEDNDTCLTPVPAPLGLTTGLRSIDNDDDYFAITVPNGETIDVIIYFIDATADVDLRLYDPLIACGGTTYLDSSTSVSDNEDVTWTNTTGAAVEVLIRVYMYTTGGCNDYDLDVAVSGLVLGTAFCFGDGSDGGTCPCGNLPVLGSEEGCLNGTGLGAKLAVTGSPSVSLDTVVLTVSQAVPSDFGIFVQNITQGAAPAPFYNGLFCLAGDAHLVRHYAPPAIQPTVTDTSGTGVNAQALTLGDYLNDTQPGVTVYYQFWGRDNTGSCGFGANFSSGIYFTWLP